MDPTGDPQAAVERRLRRERPQASDDLVDSIAGLVDAGTRPARRAGKARLVAALTVVAAGLVAGAALGGAGSAMSGASATVDGIRAVAGTGGSSASPPSGGAAAVSGGSEATKAASGQYGYPAWVCLGKSSKKGTQYKLEFSRNGKFTGGFTLVVYYGQSPGPCPPS